MTEDIRFECESCGRRIAADPSYAGEAIRCPNCHSVAWVPAAPGLPQDALPALLQSMREQALCLRDIRAAVVIALIAFGVPLYAALIVQLYRALR